MDKSLKDKTAIVCGSTDGIGKSTAVLMADRGCQIILVARNQDKLDSTLAELNNNQNHSSVCANFDNPEELKENISTALKSLNKPVDILVNNSGGPHGGPLIEADEDEFRVAFERLLICNHILAKAVVPGMKEIKWGRIINIISTSVRQVIAGLGVSNTIRGSVAQWGKSLALELGEFGITVNNVLPRLYSNFSTQRPSKN
jgi:Short-chain dehydrogenases of various substrate specificities